jgi:hypothetical protein
MASTSSTLGERSSLGGTLASTKRAKPVTNVLPDEDVVLKVGEGDVGVCFRV